MSEPKVWVVDQGQPIKPTKVTLRQAKLALLAAGMLQGVKDAISAIEDPIQREAAEIEWEYAQDVERNNGLVPMLASAIGMTDAQLDALFADAATR